MTITCEFLARAEKAEADNARLRVLKTPASRQLLNITKGCLDNAEADNARLLAVLRKARWHLHRYNLSDALHAIEVALEPKL